MRAQDTLHLKLALDAALSNPRMAMFFEEWIRRDPMARRSMPSTRVMGVDVPWSGDQICGDFKFTLSATENWYVGKETAQVVTELSRKMPPEVLRREDLPSTHGWLVFEEPWFLTDVHSNRIPIRAILWSTREVGKDELNQNRGPGVVIWCMIDIEDNMVDDYWRYGPSSKENVRELIREGMRLSPATNFAVAFNTYAFEMADTRGVYLLNEDSEGVQIERDAEDGVWRVKAERVSEGHMTLMREANVDRATIADEWDGRAAMQDWVRVRPEPIVTFLQALWRFQDTKLAAIEQQHTRKTTAKLLARRQMIPSPVSIITLRARQPSGIETGVQYHLSHQFWVRAHWRRQWYPSEGRHKSIPIAPFIKGPADAPFLVRERINAIVR